MDKRAWLGGLCGIMTGIFWGFSGVCGQFLFETRGIVSEWLVPIRLSVSGIIMFIYLFLTKREELFALARNRRDFLRTIVCGVCGTMMFQYTFLKAVQTSNAGTATVIQYMAPVFIMIYTCVRKKKIPNGKEVMAIILAVGGIFLISTHGNLNNLVITPRGLFWGLACAFAMFISSILPGKLYEKYSTQVVMGWGFVFAGIVLSSFLQPWKYDVAIDMPTIGAVSVIILLGSVAAYGLYAIMVKQIGPTKASLFVTSEAVAATVISALWLKTVFYPIDLIGFVMILSTVFILTLGKETKEEKVCRNYWIKQAGESS